MNREPDDRRLFVEGPTDEAVLRHILTRHGMDPRTLKLHSCRGFDKLRQAADVSVTSIRRLGLVIDQDEPEDAHWASLRTTLQSRGLSLPDVPTVGGTLIPGIRDGYAVGVWVMPDNLNHGTLEHFLAALIPDDRRDCWEYARASTAQARSHGARFSDRHRQKAEVYTWLAWQEQPGWPPGNAVQHGIFLNDAALAQQFVDWYRILFEVPPR